MSKRFEPNSKNMQDAAKFAMYIYLLQISLWQIIEIF